MFAVEKLAREYYFEEIVDLTAWDGTAIEGMDSENEFLHLACKHGRGKPPLNALMDIDVERVRRLPILKAAVTGKLNADVYRQVRKNKTVDKVEIIVNGEDADYIVVLGCVKDHYVVRSAYPADETYVTKVKKTGELVERIRKEQKDGEAQSRTQKSPGYGAPRQARSKAISNGLT
ncbi:hypothetical protein [Adlercreutzia sp. ZJ473]|uniref:hypothetical protein n=1 Tax=Adlercreutzia sp. ZJ473 TaxID=2722822 RepID=UPI0015544B14|nr:hypothetical protein [Adlercreutzia sp. ZJ473]